MNKLSKVVKKCRKSRIHAEAYCYDRGVFFSPEFCSRPYQNSGHTGGSFFFTRIWSPTIPKYVKIQDIHRVFLFHPNFVPDHTKIGTYRRVFLFHQNFVPDHTKIQDIQEGLSFSPEFCPRPYQNSGHTRGSFCFTRILKKKHLLKI